MKRKDLNAEDCGCAPSEAEKRSFWPDLNRRQMIGYGALGVAVAAAVTSTSLNVIAPAFAATSYPSWEDVERARQSEGAKAQEITRVEGLINQLADDVARTQAAAEAAMEDYLTTQDELMMAADLVEQLQLQIEEQSKIADESERQAGEVAAQLYRNGGNSASLELFFSAGSKDPQELLQQLGALEKAGEQSAAIYAAAIGARNTVTSLAEQAEVARSERDRLHKISEDKLAVAQQASEAAQIALDTQSQHLATLEAQLAALRDNTATTIAMYQEGVEVRRREREAAERRAREEAARRAAEAERLRREQEARDKEAREKEQANNPSSGGSTPKPGGGTSNPAPSSSGWVRPASGRRTSNYGARAPLCGSNGCTNSFHGGVDMAAGCGYAIKAAYGGRVTVAATSGWNSGWGNMIRIDHGGGIQTLYAHLQPGGIYVNVGQRVSAGQVIGSEGTTGNSFGCHLHFEVYVNGYRTNPSTFMSARGIYL